MLINYKSLSLVTSHPSVCYFPQILFVIQDLLWMPYEYHLCTRFDNSMVRDAPMELSLKADLPNKNLRIISFLNFCNIYQFGLAFSAHIGKVGKISWNRWSPVLFKLVLLLYFRHTDPTRIKVCIDDNIQTTPEIRYSSYTEARLKVCFSENFTEQRGSQRLDVLVKNTDYYWICIRLSEETSCSMCGHREWTSTFFAKGAINRIK